MSARSPENPLSPETLFARFRATGDPAALAGVFDQLAPQLLLVAAHLLRDGSAEDLVQATFLDAMRNAQRWDPSRKLAPWLLGMLGNHLHEARRQQRRTPDAERLTAREVEPPDVLAAANESLAAVHAAVAKLPRHYRQVLSLRLVHGLELQQIAHSLDAPLGTVKAQLHRGLALLRRALPAGLAPALAALLTPDRGLAAVRQVIVEAAGASGITAGVAGTAALLSTGFAMKQLVVVLVAAVALWFGARQLLSLAEASPATTAPPPVIAAAEPTQQERQTAAVAPQPGAPAQLPRRDATVADAPAAAAATNGTLVLRVTWSSDRSPARRVVVTAVDAETGATETRVSDDAGVATFTDLPAHRHHMLLRKLEVMAGGTVDVAPGQPTEHELQLDGDQRLSITVVDADGAPAPGATVWQLGPFLPAAAEALDVTDADGHLDYRGVPLERVWARRAGNQPSSAQPPTRRPDADPMQPIEVLLHLGPAGCGLVGSVLDPDGHPVADAQVLIACDDSLGVGEPRIELVQTTDADGRFATDEVPAGERFVVAAAPGFAPAMQRVTTTVSQPTSLLLQLQRGATLSGVVTDAAGRPAARQTVGTKGQYDYLPISSPWGHSRTTSTDADGRYRFDALLPGETIVRVLSKPEAEHRLTIRDGDCLTWDPVLGGGGTIAGVVLRADGVGLAGCLVRALQQERSPRPVGSWTRTEADGTFRFDRLAPVTYTVMMFSPQAGPPTDMVPMASRRDVRPDGARVVVQLDAAACADSWLVVSWSLPADVSADARVFLTPHALDGLRYPVPHADLPAGMTSYRFGPLPAGDYDVACLVEGHAELRLRDVHLGIDEQRKLPPFAFDQQRPLLVVLRHEDGRPAIGAELTVDHHTCSEREPGRYTAPATLPGRVELRANGPDFAPFSIAADFAGDAPVEHKVSAATPVRLHFRPPTPRQRWLAGLGIVITAADGAEVVRTTLHVECDDVFDWTVALRPGIYSVKCTTFDDCKANTTLTVGTTPLDVDLQLLR